MPHAGRLISGAKAFENVTPGLQITEKQLRPLTRLEPEQQTPWSTFVDQQMLAFTYPRMHRIAQEESSRH